jgi:hypothetical protein
MTKKDTRKKDATNKNITNRDATKKARGFSYQRQYCIYLFFKLINTDIKEIIEEGILGGLTYEDITTINNNDEYITYQIKYHTEKMCFNRSNKDLFKTIKNENNLQSKLKKVYFIVAKIKDTFDDTLNDWKDKKLSYEEIYNKIINLDEHDSAIVKEYRECLKFLKINPDDKILYLSKIILEEGFTYDEIIIEINDLIKNIFNIDDDKIIFYIKYYVFELFDNNWFKENVPLNINDIYSDIKLKISNISIDIDENNELFNNMYIHIIEKIKKYIEIINIDNNIIYLNNLLNEVKYFMNQFYNNFEIKHCISLMQLLHILNKKSNNNSEINELYEITNKYLCIILINMIKTTDKLTLLDEKFDNFICSIIYYHKHDINKLIDLSKSKLKNILTTDDKSFIKNNLINT